MTFHPSGQQHEISLGDQHATIVEVGGGIRDYRVGEADVLQPYTADQMCDGAHGAPLVPWPNRLADGQYEWSGTQHQVALTEPEKHNAIHGFLRWRSWQPVRHDPARVVMQAMLHPLLGYPFALDVRVDYRLTQEGLTVETTATNLGDQPAPYGCGQHPYLSPGDGLVDDCRLTLEAATRIVTDPERSLPTGTEPVACTPYDFRTGARIGELEIDYAFTDLRRDPEGRAWLVLDRPDGRSARLWVDSAYQLIEVYTGDTLAPERQRRGLGSEPMTCPPNAFQSGEQVITLQPGASTSSAWGTSLS